jgi:hypothetical protein
MVQNSVQTYLPANLAKQIAVDYLKRMTSEELVKFMADERLGNSPVGNCFVMVKEHLAIAENIGVKADFLKTLGLTEVTK